MPTSEPPVNPVAPGEPAANPLVRPTSAAGNAHPEEHLEDHFFAVGESGTFHEQSEPTSITRLARGHGARWWIATGGIAAVVVGGLALLPTLFGRKPPEQARPVTTTEVAVRPPQPAAPPAAQPAPPAPADPAPGSTTAAPAPSDPTAAAPAPVQAAPTAAEAPPAAAEAAPTAPAAAPSVAEAAPAARTAAPAAPPPVEQAAQAAAAAPVQDDGLARRCRRAATRGRDRDVLELCPPVFQADPRSADVALAIARASLERARPKEAIEWAERAIAIDANLADAYVVKGGGEQLVGRPSAARDAYKRYLQLAPTGRYARELKTILKSL